MCHCSGISASLVRESSPHHDSSPSAECLPHNAFTPNRKANCKTVRHAKTRTLLESRFECLLPLTTYTVNQECGIHPSCTECRSDHTLHARMLQSARWSHSIVLLIRHQSSDISQAKVQVADTTHFDFHRHTFNLYDLVGVEEGHLAEVKIHFQLLLPTLPVRISLKVRCMHLLSSAFADSGVFGKEQTSKLELEKRSFEKYAPGFLNKLCDDVAANIVWDHLLTLLEVLWQRSFQRQGSEKRVIPNA